MASRSELGVGEGMKIDWQETCPQTALTTAEFGDVFSRRVTFNARFARLRIVSAFCRVRAYRLPPTAYGLPATAYRLSITTNTIAAISRIAPTNRHTSTRAPRCCSRLLNQWPTPQTAS